MPRIWVGGKPECLRAKSMMASMGLVTMRTGEVGEWVLIWPKMLAIISEFFSKRSSLVMPGWRGKPAVMIKRLESLVSE